MRYCHRIVAEPVLIDKPDGKRSVALLLANLHGGGAERVMTHLADGLTQRGWSVDLLLMSAEGPYLADLAKTVRVVDLRAPRTIASIRPLVRYLRAERPEALVSALDYVNVAAIWARRWSRVATRVIATVHTTYSEAAARWVSLKGTLARAAMRWSYPWADAIVTVSRGVADDLVRTAGVPPHLLRVIYNPVITPHMQRSAREPVDHPWFGPGQPGVILGIGRLIPLKDFTTLIKAFALLRKDRDVRLLILGEGEERGRLETLLRELGLEREVGLPGFVKNPFAYLSRSSLFVLSSTYEALPTVLIEALALGVPVVSTACRSGPEEILNKGQYGRLVPVGDVSALADAMRTTLVEPRREIPPAALRPFTVDVAVDEYIKVISEATRG